MNLTSALTRLLTDPQLRHQFRCDGDLVAQRLGIRGPQREAFLAMDADDLDRQARCLLNKRFHEVCCIIPQTINQIGRDARPWFYRYAVENWPMGHRRHWVDAAQFCKWLSRHRKGCASRAESNWVRFVLSRRRCIIVLVSDLMVGGRPRVALQLFTRRRGGPPRQRSLYFSSWSHVPVHFGQ